MRLVNPACRVGWYVRRVVERLITGLPRGVWFDCAHPLRDIEMTSLPDVDKYEGECGRAIFRSAENPY